MSWEPKVGDKIVPIKGWKDSGADGPFYGTLHASKTQDYEFKVIWSDIVPPNYYNTDEMIKYWRLMYPLEELL